MDSAITFTEQLIKGRITEIIFEEMFRATHKYTIIPLGYEKTTPMLAQYNGHPRVRHVLENIRNAPDFALLTENKDDVLLVEVKYRHDMYVPKTLEIAKGLNDKWEYCFLFMADEESFYFSQCKDIINNNGMIGLLSEDWISKNTRDRYHALLRKFLV